MGKGLGGWIPRLAGAERENASSIQPFTCQVRKRRLREVVTLTGLPSSLDVEAGLGLTRPQDLRLQRILYYFFIWATLRGVWDLSLLTRDQTHALHTASMES